MEFYISHSSGDVQVTDFTVPGFDYLRASRSVNLRDPTSLSSATYSGRLHGPFPSFNSGYYNTSKDRVVFEKGVTIPFVGLSLNFRTEVKLNLYSYITEKFFHGRLENPFLIDVTGRFDALNCRLSMAGLVNLPTQGLMIQTNVVLEFCNNCSYICKAQAVGMKVDLAHPLNLTLHGGYMLSDNITEVAASGKVEISNVTIDVSTTVQSQVGKLSVQEIFLHTHLQSPFDLDIRGKYSRSTSKAALSGSLNLPIVTLMLQLTVDIESKTLSALQFSGAISSPFMMNVFGSYALENNTSNELVAGGHINVSGLVNLKGTVKINLLTRTVSDITFEGMLAEPLSVNVFGQYNAGNTLNGLKLSGSIALLSDSMITFNVKLNTSELVSVKEIGLVGKFPPPLDFISYEGQYNQQCSCAVLTGRVVQSFVTVVASTNLSFAVNQTHPSITEVQIQVTFHSPINLQLSGLYKYSNGSNSKTIDVMGQFNIPQVILSTNLQLILEGMSLFTVSQLHFSGRFPSPLSLDVQGDYNTSTNDLILGGSLKYDFAQLDASVIYSFRDDVHNMSSMLRDVSFIGKLLDPFQLNIQGHYVFATSTFMLGGVVNLNYLTLDVDVSIDTSTTPPSIDSITFSGGLMTPIPFQGEFQGTYNRQTRKALLHSHLNVMGAVLLNAMGNLTLGTTNEFSLESVSIEGSLESPLSVEVAALYVPSNTTELDLMGQMSIGPVSFMVSAHAEKETVMNQLVIKKVTISGEIQSPFVMMFSGTYMAGNTLLLRGALQFTDLSLTVTAPVNLTKVPREISSYQFKGQLKSPFNTSVSGRYFSDSEDLTLSGMLDIGALCFTVDVILNTSSALTVKRLRFRTTYNPLLLVLTGDYNRAAQKLELTGNIEISPFSIIAMAHIDMNQEMKSLSSFTMSVTTERPPLTLSGIYDPSTRNALLQGELTLSTFEFRTSALLSLGANRKLHQIMFSLNYTIPFGSKLQFLLTGIYDNNNEWLILEGRIGQSAAISSSDTHALVITSTTQSPTLRLTSLVIPKLDIGSLVSQYIGLAWPSNAFPLVFSNVAIYQAHANLMYGEIDYKIGFHARGEVKIFVFPEIIIDASLIRSPSPQFRVSFQLKRVLDWSIFAICGSTDTFCNVTGPSLSVQVGSGENQFIFEGGFRFFNVKVGTSQLAITKDRMSATFTPSEQVRNLLFGLNPGPITIYWNNEGFHTNVKIPGLKIKDFKFTNVQSRNIC